MKLNFLLAIAFSCLPQLAVAFEPTQLIFETSQGSFIASDIENIFVNQKNELSGIIVLDGGIIPSSEISQVNLQFQTQPTKIISFKDAQGFFKVMMRDGGDSSGGG